METFKPILGLTFIESTEGLMMLKHQFEKADNGSYQLGAGVGVDELEALSMVKEIGAKVVKSEEISNGFINPKVFYSGDFTQGWLVKKHKRKLHFKKGSEFSIEVTLPNIVFFTTSSKEMFVFAVNDDEITPSTKLFNCPLWNLYGNGTMCFGSVAKPSNYKDVSAWESCVFDAFNTHSNNAQTLKGINNDMEYIKYLKGLKGKKIPKNRLAPVSEYTTVQDFLVKKGK